ncbi:MAG: hypothetical protein EA393_02200, partial [Bacteroidetes bacterium]
MRNVFKFLVIIISLSFMSCNFSGERKSETQPLPGLPQSEDMLLAGVSEAVCYSGFRTGQHPDRGAGAINPSYEEILEDLMNLKEQTPFRLFRLYDCEENSQMVLEVIREHNLDFKVMLGIWLRAEIDSYETCEWL